MDLPTLAAIAGIVALPTTLLLWMMSKIHNDISTQSADSNTKWTAMNARYDALQAALNARVDLTQSIIMKMLEKQGK